jgi:hypothetical protein
MTRHLSASVLIAFALGRSAAAAEATPPPMPVDVIPLVGLGGGENLEADMPGVPPAISDPSATLGLAFDVFVRPDAWFTGFISHQRLRFTADASSLSEASAFDFGIDYLQFGGGYGAAEGRVRPFVTASVGLTRYGASSGGEGSTLGASGSLGGGIKVPVGKRLSLRFEVRGYATLTDAAVSVACGPGCSVRFGASGWYQLAGSFGLAVRL